MVGQLFFGAKLTSKPNNTFDESYEAMQFYRSKFGLSEDGDVIDKEANATTSYEQPYETDEHYLVINETNKSAYNCGKFLGNNLIVNPEWEQMLKDRAAKADVEIIQIGWHLVGHYN